ncbi:uncharacterized protein J4E88_000041 [Alternaria novae-zelandiae]|uniref:uncharacterized protein n=1 Tax=Alternaria novae-zelandiae TaxID=430562 RepID=UPI0020C2E60E|nr:uncharacterized protein J4E88_000041 [Alternaria novae-zelandiae]KAI4695871.1 hypothetical protein J4E88_000041 [Alternaria novae-zelandiae]
MSRIEITSDPNLVVSGRGMIARQQIERGTLIHTELPLIMVKVERSKATTGGALHQFYQSQEHPNSRVLIDAVNALSAPEIIAFGNLAGSAPIAGAPPLTQRQDIVARFRHNAWGIKGENTYLVVYDMLSSLNHSCVPNAVVDIWNGDPNGDITAPLGQEIRRRIERMEVYIHLLQHLGVWDAEVSEAQSDYRKAMSAAATGLNVQKYLYSDEGAVALKQELGAESAKCQVNDSSLIHHITGTGSNYPLY